MKNNLMICGCLSIFFACNGGEDKERTISSEFSKTSTEQNSEMEDSEKNEEESFEDLPGDVGRDGNQQVQEIVNPVDTDEPSKEEESIKENNSRKTETVKPEESDLTTDPLETVKQEKKQQKANVVLISVVPDLMKFNKEVFTVVAGQEVVIELDNPDGMQHNMVISKPGTLKQVGAAADALARDPKGAQKQYVPEIPEVLFATPLLEPGDVYTLTFTAPSEPGDYPFICTFPGHWRMMNGIMKVTK